MVCDICFGRLCCGRANSRSGDQFTHYAKEIFKHLLTIDFMWESDFHRKKVMLVLVLY